MLIGASEQWEGLYYFRGMVTTTIMKTIDGSSFDLLHKRLGHPSSKVLDLVPNSGSSKNGSLWNKACDVCLRAKQSRDRFPISDNKTIETFSFL